MAGIMASAASNVMLASDTAANKIVTGYLTQEQVTLTVAPSGTNYAWSIAKPSGDTIRSDLSAKTGASVTFTPQLAGYYVVTCIVDGVTTYVLRIGTTAVTVAANIPVVQYSPQRNTSVPSPSNGVHLYYSTESSALVTKDTLGNVVVVGSGGGGSTATSTVSGESTVTAVTATPGWTQIGSFVASASETRQLTFRGLVSSASLTGRVRVWDTVTSSAVTNSTTTFTSLLTYANCTSPGTFAVVVGREYRIECEVTGASGPDYYGSVDRVSVAIP